MSDQLSYAEGIPSDFIKVAEIFNANIEAGDSTLWQKNFSVSDIVQMVERFSEREKLYTLRRGAKIIGWGMIIRYHEKAGYAKACETSVFLDRSEVGKGFGTKFKRFILHKCGELGYHHVNAKILAANQRSIYYNLKLGYEMVGIQKEIGFVNGAWKDVAIMQYLIK